MDLKAIQAALLFGGQSGPGGDWAEAVCAPFTASGGTVVCSPLAGRALTVAAAGATTQAGGGTAAPGNIRALGGVGENGSLTLTGRRRRDAGSGNPADRTAVHRGHGGAGGRRRVTETHRAVKLTVDGSENWISWTNPRDTADITVPGTIGSLGTSCAAITARWRARCPRTRGCTRSAPTQPPSRAKRESSCATASRRWRCSKNT